MGKGSHKRRTRKAGRGSSRMTSRSPLSVEALHSSFEKMDARLRHVVESGVTDKDLGHAVARAWSVAFQHELSAPAIQGLVTHYRALYGGSKAGRRTRRARRGQRGGMAPLDWTMGQGTTSTTFGRFPDDFSTSAQAVKSLDLGRFFENSIGRSCDSTGGYDTLASQTATQKGGGILDAVAAGHPPTSVPQNVLQSTVSALQGAGPTAPSSDPAVPAWTPTPATPQAFDSSAVSNLAGFSSVYTGY